MTRLGDGREEDQLLRCVGRGRGRDAARSVVVNFTQITSIRYTESERAIAEKERRQVDRPDRPLRLRHLQRRRRR